jgi:hypothetical protein
MTGPVTSSHGHGNEQPGSINSWNLLTQQLSASQGLGLMGLSVFSGLGALNKMRSGSARVH